MADNGRHAFLRNLFGAGSSNEGLGLLSFSTSWTLITQGNPLIWPLQTRKYITHESPLRLTHFDAQRSTRIVCSLEDVFHIVWLIVPSSWHGHWIRSIDHGILLECFQWPQPGVHVHVTLRIRRKRVQPI
jgi:hypothetical protein